MFAYGYSLVQHRNDPEKIRQYCLENGYEIVDIFIDDELHKLPWESPGFLKLMITIARNENVEKTVILNNQLDITENLATWAMAKTILNKFNGNMKVIGKPLSINREKMVLLLQDSMEIYEIFKNKLNYKKSVFRENSQNIGRKKGSFGVSSEILDIIWNFHKEGFSCGAISKELTSQNIPTAQGKPVWHRGSVWKIIKQLAMVKEK